MNFKEHLILGVVLSIIFIGVTYFWQGWFEISNSNLILQIVILMFVSPLAADLDHRHGKLREWVTVIGLVLALLGIIFDKGNITKFGVIIGCIAYLVYYTTKHRGYTHTIWFTGVYSVIVFYITNNIQLSILGFVGYYSHLIGDKLWYRFF